MLGLVKTKTMSSAEKLKLTTLNNLKDKLLDLSSRSRKIRFNITKRLTWDLTELLNKSAPNLAKNFWLSVLNLVIGSKKIKENFSLDLEQFFQPLTIEDSRKFQEQIIFLLKKNLTTFQEKGYKSLFLGTFFLRGYFYNHKNVLRLVNAPLFLVPSDLEKIKNLVLVFKAGRNINYNLFYYLQKELNLEKEKFINFLTKLEKNDGGGSGWENYLFFLNNELQYLLSTSQLKIKFSSTLASFLEERPIEGVREENSELNPSPFAETTLVANKNDKNSNSDYFPAETFVKLTLTNKPKNYSENQLEIVLNFCLTIDSEPNLSLFRDFEQIVEEYSQEVKWSNSALKLLRGEIEGIDYFSEPAKGIEKPKPLYTPFLSDPSQTRILRIIFQNFSKNTLCIDGPPGTGKSQLICNLLANALIYQQKVLVVCEKEVALKVIYDKLNTLDLNRSIIKINQLAQTPQVYRDILSHEENSQQEIANNHDPDYYQQIAKLEVDQTTNLKKIAKYGEIEKNFQNVYQIPLSEVYLKFTKKYQLSPTIIDLNKWVRKQEQLEKLTRELKNYIDKFVKIFGKWKPTCLQLKKMFLDSAWEFEFSFENQNNFQQVIINILKELKGEKNQSNLISKILRIKLISKYNKQHQSVSLLENKLRDLAELRTNKEYQKFLSFLEIETFADFWQKCSNEFFLLNIQQFIAEEFLNIGELSINLSEDTKKSVDYLLKEVLINQEFSYLDNYVEITEQAVYFNWINEVEMANKELLASWNYEELAKIHQEQSEITKKKINLVKLILKNKQKENLDKLFTNQALKKELSKKRKITPLKKLFPELVNYFPLWLSTPEIIASITNRQEPVFDFLIFDEASQISLEKSIPLWARTKKLIIIGDEQQLPPTDFFKSHLENEEEIWEENDRLLSELEEEFSLAVDDLEKNSSLLTYAKKYANNNQRLTLLYHYRSQHPKLIEFSNQAFYRGDLQIVAASELRKKTYLPIEYHYQERGKWKNSENEVEAQYIANLLKTLPENKKVGIITFNSKQRDFLIDLISEINEKNELFIKSLEEVQGDERDIIIFSIGYAPNAEGKILLNFGPLSQEGGEKRLNVAISRAREKIIVVTSLLPEDLTRIIDTDEKRKLGPKLFKKYLEYAYYCSQEREVELQNILEKSLPKIVNNSLYEKSQEIDNFGSLFEKQVYNELVKQNYRHEIHQQVKSIGYSIDLAIWDKQLGQYILGIECDGEHWHGKLENIERDIYRQQLLEEKGWKIMRILSRDWSRNKEREITRINNELEKMVLS